jgi:import inner membrane translocase subunit TIM23
MLARSALCPSRAFANRYPPAIIAPLSAATAPFSTCTRPSKLQQPRTSPASSPFRSTIVVRKASSAPSQPAVGGSAPPAQPLLTWNDFFALRRTRRRIGQACSGVGAIAVTYNGLTAMISNGYDATLSAQLGGLDPFMLMGLSTLGMMAVGWLIGPIFGNQVFNLRYRGVLGEFTTVSSVAFLAKRLTWKPSTDYRAERFRLLQPHQAPSGRSDGVFSRESATRLLWREDWKCDRLPAVVERPTRIQPQDGKIPGGQGLVGQGVVTVRKTQTYSRRAGPSTRRPAALGRQTFGWRWQKTSTQKDSSWRFTEHVGISRCNIFHL